jgi:quercetin dioxygenase-like cupin family protein
VSTDGILLPPGAGERIENPLGGEIVFKARAAQTAGAMTVFEAVNPPGQGPPLHVHDTLDEAIHVLDGTLRVRLADRVEEAPAGAFVFIPRGLPHTWEGHGAEPVRFLVVLAPAGLEAFFEGTAEAGGEQADDAFGRFGGEDLRVVGPPLAASHPL